MTLSHGASDDDEEDTIESARLSDTSYFTCSSNHESFDHNGSVDEASLPVDAARRHRRRNIILSDSESDTMSRSGGAWRRSQVVPNSVSGSNQVDVQTHRASIVRTDSSDSLPSLLCYSPEQPRYKETSTPRPINLPSDASQSLKKTATSRKIPRSPHRESNDKFWSEQETGRWNEIHSHALLTTPLQSLNLNRCVQLPNALDLQTGCLKKTQAKSLNNKARKDFVLQRESLAERILKDFIDTICPELRGHRLLPGPIQVVWSKTLISTAGRATYSKSKRMGNIELSTKVIDSEERLRSTLAHELCHMLVWVIDGQFQNPHGKEFKFHGRSFEKSLNITVETTHNYEINYNYQWQCTNASCEKVYGRHSKSIDPVKVVCSMCHAQLLQTRPKPRQSRDSKNERVTDSTISPSKNDGLSRYQEYLKGNIDRVRKEHVGLKYAELIKIVSAEYRQTKEGKAKSSKPLMALLERDLLSMSIK